MHTLYRALQGGPPSSLPILKWIESRPLLTTAGGGGQDCFLKHGMASGRNSICGGQDSSRCTATPHLEYTDESFQAVHITQDRIFADSVEHIYDVQNTWGSLAGANPLMNSTQHFRKWDMASVGVPTASSALQPLPQGSMTTMFRSEMTFVKAVHVDELIVMHQVQRPSVQNWSLAIGHDGTDPAPTVIEFTYTTPRGLSSTNQTWHIPTGAWFGAWSSDQLGQAAIYFNRGVPMLLHALAPRTGGNMLQQY